MTYILKNSFIYVMLAVAAVCLFPHLLFAQGSVTFSVSPTIFDLSANPGQSWRSTIRVINANPYELTVTVTPVNFTPSEDGGTPQFIPVATSTKDGSSLAEWITTPTALVVNAEQTAELPLLISVPNNAPPGGYYAALLISTQSVNDGEKRTQVLTSQVISSLVFLRVSGELVETSSIRSFRSTDYIVNRPTATFELRIENKGNVHVQPQGEITITNMWGQKRGTIPVNQQTLFGNVLPNSVRRYAFDWTSEWSISDIGRYTAEATLAYGYESKQFMSAETSFWVIPWKIILSLIALFGGFFWFIAWAIRLYVRKMLSLAGVSYDTVPTTLTVHKPLPKPSIAAPFEAGILDLRNELGESDSLRSKVITAVLFVRLYWVFFVAVVTVVCFITFLVWFVMDARTESREYSVTVPETTEQLPTTEPNGTGPRMMLRVINQSGSSSGLDILNETLQNSRFAVADVSTSTATETTTTIVYSPNVRQDAQELSLILGDAKLVQSEQVQQTDEIVIYLGTDRADSE
jgi:hypothetical protein